MGNISKKSIVVLPFPFSDLTGVKKRPALVIAEPMSDDVMLCQITSVNREDGYEVHLDPNDLDEGYLRQESLIRTNKIFTGTMDIIDHEIGKITDDKMNEVEDKIVGIIKGS